MNKEIIIKAILDELEKELSTSLIAANNAHKDATDDQSVAETQYDTVAIEASYLAEGQSRRVQEFQQAILAYQQLPLRVFSEDCAINTGALVQLAQDEDKHHWFFIGPAAGGFRTSIAQNNITVITPHSPIGKALVGQYCDENIIVKLGKNTLTGYIHAIC